MAGCLTLSDSLQRLKELQNDLQRKCTRLINRKIKLEKAFLEAEIESEQRVYDVNAAMQAEAKATILANMNSFYKLIDLDGTQEFKDLFATRNMTFSGGEEQEYYFSRTYPRSPNSRKKPLKSSRTAKARYVTSRLVKRSPMGSSWRHGSWSRSWTVW